MDGGENKGAWAGPESEKCVTDEKKRNEEMDMLSEQGTSYTGAELARHRTEVPIREILTGGATSS